MTEPRHPLGPLSRATDSPTDSKSGVFADLFGEPLDPGYADAAARRAATGAAPRRAGARLVAVATLAVVGLLLAVAYQQVVAEKPARSQVRADLQAQIHDRQEETQRLQVYADDLRDEVAELRDQQLANPGEARRLRELEAATGLGRVHGPGVVVRVNDGPPVAVDPSTGQPAVDPQARILYRDLQQIANALWAAGAEAVAINDRRLTATATIRSASGAILIDRAPVASPYRIVAVGPDDLAQRFAATEAAALMELLVHEFGIEYEVRSESELSLPAAAEPQLRYATPMPHR